MNPLASLGRGLLTGLRGVGKGALAGIDYAALGGDVGGLLSEIYPEGAPSNVKRNLRQAWLGNFVSGMSPRASMPALMDNYRSNAIDLLGSIYTRKKAKDLQASRDAAMGGSGAPMNTDTLKSLARFYISNGDVETGTKLLTQAESMNVKPVGEPIQLTNSKTREQVMVQRWSDGSLRPLDGYGPKPSYSPIGTGNETKVVDMNDPSKAPAAVFQQGLTPGEQQQGQQFNTRLEYDKGRDRVSDQHWNQDWLRNIANDAWGHTMDLRNLNQRDEQNKVQNSIASGNLSVSQGNLGVAQERLKMDQNKPAQMPQAYTDRALGLANLNSALDSYEQMISGKKTVDPKTGAVTFDSSKAIFSPMMDATGVAAQAIRTRYTDLLMKLKEANRLGALSGPDLTLMEKQLIDPLAMYMNGDGWFDKRPGGRIVGQPGIQAQLDTLRAGLRSEAQNLTRTFANQPLRGQPSWGELFQILDSSSGGQKP